MGDVTKTLDDYPTVGVGNEIVKMKFSYFLTIFKRTTEESHRRSLSRNVSYSHQRKKQSLSPVFYGSQLSGSVSRRKKGKKNVKYKNEMIAIKFNIPVFQDSSVSLILNRIGIPSVLLLWASTGVSLNVLDPLMQ